MLTLASYFLCHIRLLKHEEQNNEYVTPSESQPAKTIEKEMLKCSTFSAPLKSEKTEEIYQDDYYPGTLIYLFILKY